MPKKKKKKKRQRPEKRTEKPAKDSSENQENEEDIVIMDDEGDSDDCEEVVESAEDEESDDAIEQGTATADDEKATEPECDKGIIEAESDGEPEPETEDDVETGPEKEPDSDAESGDEESSPQAEQENRLKDLERRLGRYRDESAFFGQKLVDLLSEFEDRFGLTSRKEELLEKEKLQSELESTREELSAAKGKAVRMLADLDNARKRARREIDDARKRARAEIIREIIPVFDSMDYSLMHIEETEDNKFIIDGVRMVQRQFASSMSRFGLEKFSALGEAFDPMKHEAMGQAPADEEHPPGMVVEEMAQGYMLGDMLLRPAQVLVAMAAPEKKEEKEEKEEQSMAETEENTASTQDSGDSQKEEDSEDAGDPQDAGNSDDSEEEEDPENAEDPEDEQTAEDEESKKDEKNDNDPS